MKQYLIEQYECLFHPINEKHYGLWKKPPLRNDEELVEYAINHSNEPKYIEIYTSVDDKEIGTLRTLFLDFDLTKKAFIKENITEDILNDFFESQGIEKTYELANQEIDECLKQLSDDDINGLYEHIKRTEKELISNMNESEVQKYYLSKIREGYLKEPFEEAKKVAEYLNNFNIKTILNWSGSKGIHLRIPLDEIHFENDELNKDPKLFLNSLAESLESAALDKKIKTSSIDYNVLSRNRGLQRLPCSKNEKSHLYANFINPSWDYDEAIKHLDLEQPDYIPQTVNKKTNTKNFLKSAIVIEAIATAQKEKFSDEDSDNPHYTVNSNEDKLLEMIGKVYIEGSRNEIGYRIVHVLRRSGYSQKQVEEIFKKLHNSNNDYANTIGGSIKSAFEKDISQLCGLQHLIKGITELANIQNKSEVIKYLKTNFSFYDKPKETRLEPFILGDKEISVILFENKSRKWFIFKEVSKNIDLKIDFGSKLLIFLTSDLEKELVTTNFTYKENLLKIKKADKENIKEILDDENINNRFFIEISQYFRNFDGNVFKEFSPSYRIYKLFYSKNVNVRYARQQLGHFLKENGMILRKRINNPYILDKKSNGFEYVEIDDILMKLNENIFKNKDMIHTTDVKEALGFIADRRTPVYNIVKFPNCLYDMENFEVIKSTDEPIFTLTEVKFNYNPEAKGEIIVNFLKTSLGRPDDSDEEIKEKINGFLEMIGYLLTSGNKLNSFFIIAGIGGSGKGVATDLIIAIFGSENVGGLQLQELTPDNRFATAHLESKQVNIVRDSPDKPIGDTGLLKQITGYDDVAVEPKGKDKYMIPKEEVPDMILVCNNIPKFKNGIEEAIVQRVVLFEFLNRFRGTDMQNVNLEEEILSNPEEMEWLIYNGIESYKDMVQANDGRGRDFKARVDEQKTRELLGKHTDPISHVLGILVKYSDEAIYEEPIIAAELNKLILYLAKKEGISINQIDNNGLIKPTVLAGKIREHFSLENWTTKTRHIPKLGKSVTIYPGLYKTPEYDEYLKEMTDHEESKI